MLSEIGEVSNLLSLNGRLNTKKPSTEEQDGKLPPCCSSSVLVLEIQGLLYRCVPVNNTRIISVFVIAAIIFYCVFEGFLSCFGIFHTRNFDTVSYKTSQCLNWKTLLKSVVKCWVFSSV